MNKIKFIISKMILSLLVFAPIPTVSFAAQNKLTDIKAQSVKNKALRDFLRMKTQIFKPYETQSSLESAFLLFKIGNQHLVEDDLNREFHKVVNTLINAGMVEINETEIMSKIPSMV